MAYNNGKTKLNLGPAAIYLVLLVVSVWASGESFARSIDFPRLVCYVFGFILSAGAAFGLTLVNSYYKPGYNRIASRLFAGLGIFLVLWLISLLSNTHNLYYVGAAENIRENELRNVKSRLELVKTKGVVIFTNRRETFEAKVESEITNLKNQIMNVGDPGRGPKTEAIINRLEQQLGTEITDLTPPSNDMAALRKYSTQYANLIRGILDKKLNAIDENIKELEKNINTPEYGEMLNRLEQTIAIPKGTRDVEKTKHLLRDAYALYNKLIEYVEDLTDKPFLAGTDKIELQPLPETPESIDIEHIANSWKRVFRGDFELSRFVFALFIAFGIDLAAYIIWYFGVLPRSEHHRYR